MELPAPYEDSVTIRTVRLVQELVRVVDALSDRMEDLEKRQAVCDTRSPAPVTGQSADFPTC